MPNYFDQFDEPKTSNYFDQFDAPQKPVESRGVGGFLKDTGLDVAKGVVGLGESVVGLGNLASFGMLGKAAESVGYDPKQTSAFLAGLQSDARQKSDREVADTKGFWNTLGALGTHPDVLFGNIVESLPGTVGAGAVGGMLVKRLAATAATEATALGLTEKAATDFIAQKVRDQTFKIAAAASGAEGAQTAGSIAESGRQAGKDWSDYVAPALAAGLGTAAIGMVSGKIGQKLGIGDVETDIAARTAGVKGVATSQGGAFKRIGGEMLKEGALEEMPQSYQEQAFQNIATGKPWQEGTSEAAAQGLMAGAGMAGGHAVLTGRAEPKQDAAPSPTKPPAKPADILPTETFDDALKAFTESVSTPIAPIAPAGPTLMESLSSIGADWQNLGVTPSGEVSNIAAREAGQQWKSIAPEQTGSLEQQRAEIEREGAALSQARDARLADVGQQWQDLGITNPADDLQAQRMGMREEPNGVPTGVLPADSGRNGQDGNLTAESVGTGVGADGPSGVQPGGLENDSLDQLDKFPGEASGSAVTPTFNAQPTTLGIQTNAVAGPGFTASNRDQWTIPLSKRNVQNVPQAPASGTETKTTPVEARTDAVSKPAAVADLPPAGAGAAVQADGVKVPERTRYYVTKSPAYDGIEPLSVEDADFELEALENSAKKGRLTPEVFAQSEIGRRLDAATIIGLQPSLKTNPVGTIQALRSHIANKAEPVSQPAQPGTPGEGAGVAKPKDPRTIKLSQRTEVTNAQTQKAIEASPPAQTSQAEVERYPASPVGSASTGYRITGGEVWTPAERLAHAEKQRGLLDAESKWLRSSAATAPVSGSSWELKNNKSKKAETLIKNRRLIEAWDKEIATAKDLQSKQPPALANTAPVATESVAKVEESKGWSERNNNITGKPSYGYNPSSGAFWATVQNPSNGVYEIEYQKGSTPLHTEEITGTLTQVKFHVQERVSAMGTEATHKDPGKAPEAATAPVIAQSLAKAARKEDNTQKEMRLWLLDKIDAAVKLTEDYSDYQQSIEKNGQDIADSIFFGKNSRNLGLNTQPGNGMITFDVPGDGKFKVRNSLRGLMEFRAKVEAKSGTGFTDKTTKAKGLPASTGVAKGSSSQIEALSNMLEELDFEAAMDYRRETGVNLNDAKISPEVREQFKAYLKDGTLPPPPFSPSKYWEYPGIDGADKDGNPIRKATLTKQIGADEYQANVTGTNATGFKYNITKNGKSIHAMLTSNSFANALKLAEDAINAIQPEVVKPKDTGWNMRGTGYAGKRYIGRNITLDDGREVVARIYENAGLYEEAEVKVDGARVFAKTDRYKAEKLADDFIRTLTAKEAAPENDRMGFTKKATRDDGFTLTDGNMLVTVESTSYGFQASHGSSAKSGPRLTEQQAIEWAANIRDESKKIQKQESKSEPDKEFRNPDTLNVLRNPIEDKDWFKLKNGEEWQARQGYSGRGWSLVRNGNLHPEARNFESQSDFIRSVIEVTGQTQAAGQVVAPVEANDEPIPAVSEAQARKQFEWRNMGQKDGNKSHLLFFFESEKDKGTGAAMNRGEVSLYQGSSGWQVDGGDGTRYKSLADAKKAAIDLAIPLLQDQGYVLKPAAEATAILDAADITGKERIDALKDVKKGDITPDELKAAYPAKASEFSSIEKELQSKATKQESDGSIGVVMPGGDVQFVPLADAVKAAEQAIANGTKAVPFQIHNETGIRLGDTDRVIAAIGKPDNSVKPEAKEGIDKPASFSRGPWRSALRDGLSNINAKALSPEMWADGIKGLVNKGAAKADEVEWSGITDWLKLQTGRVTKEQVMAYLDGNGVQVQEVVNTDNTEALKDWPGNKPLPANTKYSQYQLPGGANYREVLLTLPTAYDKWSKSIEADVRALGITKPMDEVSGNDLINAGASKDLQSRYYAVMSKGSAAHNYQSNHWQQPNVLAHLRVNDRTDADGKRVLFVEELQSDWGQDGKKKGFNSDLEAQDKKRRDEARRKADAILNGRQVTELTYDEYSDFNHWQDQATGAATQFKGVPSAPFVDKTDKWLNLALKRIIKMAVDGGYDKVAFVNGEQSAERYDLSKQVSDIQYTKEANGKYYIVVGGPRGGIHSGEHTASELEDYVGKELAQRIVDRADDSMKELTGLDLKVGGEGMRTFYDRIVPNTVNALLKKLGGGKMEQVLLDKTQDAKNDTKGIVDYKVFPIGGGRFELRSTESQTPLGVFDSGDAAFAEAHRLQSLNRKTQPGFTLTPAMIEKASQGLPLFDKQGGQSKPTGLTPTQFTIELSKAFGAKVAERLQAKGVVVPLADQSKLPAHVVPFLRDGDIIYGFYDPKTDRTYAVLENLTPEMVKGLVLHEVGVHFGFEAMLGEAKYNSVMKRLDFMRRAGNKAVKEAYAEAQKNSVRDSQVPEETLAYLVQTQPEMGIVKEIIARIKAFLFSEFGIGGKYLTEADLTMLARAAVDHSSRVEDGGSVVPAFMRGTSEAMTNSNGARGLTNMAQQDNFDPDQAEAQEVQSAIEGGSMKDAAKWLVKNGTPVQKAIAERIVLQLDRLTKAGIQLDLRVVHRGELAPIDLLNARGLASFKFDNKTGNNITVILNGADVEGKIGTSKEILLHELVHAATMGVVHLGRSDASSRVAQDVKDLRAISLHIARHFDGRLNEASSGGKPLSAFETRIRDRANNAFTSLNETLAWALSNPDAQVFLEGIPYKNNQSTWSAFVTTIRNLLGLPAKLDSALSEVLRVADNLMSDRIDDVIRMPGIGEQMAYQTGINEGMTEAIDSNGAFSRKVDQTEANPDIRYSRSLTGGLQDGTNNPRGIVNATVEHLNDRFKAPGTLGWWHKSVGTQYNLAQRSAPFKRVFDSVQNFINDTSYYATEAASLAPKLIPKLESWKDIIRKPIASADSKAIAAPIFEGTLTWARDESGKLVKMSLMEERAKLMTVDQKSQRLLRSGNVTEQTLKMWRGLPVDQYEAIINGKYERDMLKAGVVFTDSELKQQFNLTPEQISLYREFRAATGKSLTDLTISHMLKLGGKDTQPIADQALGAKSAAEASQVLADYLRSLAAEDDARSEVLMDTADRIVGMSDKATDLIDRGYAPLSRFGQYTVDVISGGERVYFGMFESKLEANKMADKMKANYPESSIAQGTVSQEEYKLFAGVTPETLELFGDLLGLDSQGSDAKNVAFQEYLKAAKSNRSAMKRLIQRKGIAGFSEDAGRVLAGFIYSNARQTSSNLHAGEITQATADIPKGEGEVKDAAIKLATYVQNPQEEAQAIRGLMFAQYIGGSVASAMVNLTQPFTMTLPWLSQYGGITKAAKQMASATKDALKDKTGDTKLDAALHRAEEEGIVSPQEVHQLQGQASGRGSLQSGDGTKMGDAKAFASNSLSRVQLAWGKLFGVAEQFNRRSTFIAAYRTAVEQGIADPAGFAAKAIAETQGVYNKGNKPAWARGAVGSTLFTFKQFSISYMEMVHRMALGPNATAETRMAALYAMGILLLFAGVGGLPGADDLDDLISGLLQTMGYNFDSKSARRAFLVKALGAGGQRFVEHGLSGLPGVPVDVSGRLGLGNLIPGTGLLTKKTDHTSDVAELAGPVGDLAKRGFQASGQVLKGDIGGAAVTVSPLAARNLAKAYDMEKMGMYRDQSGKKVIDTDTTEAVFKAIGFQPNTVKQVQDATGEAQRTIGLNKMRETEIADKWAQGMFEKDKEKVQDARDELAEWNRNNPDMPIRINYSQIFKRLKEMNLTKEQRIQKTAPKEIRATVARELAEAR